MDINCHMNTPGSKYINIDWRVFDEFKKDSFGVLTIRMGDDKLNLFVDRLAAEKLAGAIFRMQDDGMVGGIAGFANSPDLDSPLDIDEAVEEWKEGE